jgi:alpha-beta hydrolase superfamily lysophospholipase
MGMSSRSEAQFQSFDQTALYFQKWGVKNPRGSLVITHGHGEHSGCYHRVVAALAGLELDIYAWDMRGHGKSGGLRGYAAEFTDYCKDYELLLRKLTNERQLLSKPLFLLAHSMGALVQTKTLCDHPNLPIAAQALSSPMFGLSLEVPAYKDKAAAYLNLILPKLTLSNGLQFSDLTRDSKVMKEFDLDVLRHDRMSSGAYLGSQNVMSELKAKAGRISLPTLIQMSENDPVTSTAAAREIFSKLSSTKKQMIEYSDRRHEIYNDLGREQVYEDLNKFFSSFL